MYNLTDLKISVGNYEFPKLSAEVDNVSRPLITEDIERLKKKTLPKLDVLFNIDKR